MLCLIEMQKLRMMMMMMTTTMMMLMMMKITDYNTNSITLLSCCTADVGKCVLLPHPLGQCWTLKVGTRRVH